MCRAPVQRHRARVQGPGLSPGEPGLGPDAVVPGPGTDRRRRRLPRRLRFDHRRVRGPRPPGDRGAPGAQPGAGPGAERGPGPGHRRLPDLPRRRRHPRPGRPAGPHRPTEGHRLPRRPGLRLRARLLVRGRRAQPALAPAVRGGPGQLPARRPPRPARHADGGVEQGVPPRVRRARGPHLPAGALRGHPLDLPGAAGRGVRRRPGPGLRALPPAAHRIDPDHPHRPPPGDLRPVRPGLRVPRRAARAGALALHPAPPDGRALLRRPRRPAPPPPRQPGRVLRPGLRPAAPLPRPGRAEFAAAVPVAHRPGPARPDAAGRPALLPAAVGAAFGGAGTGRGRLGPGAGPARVLAAAALPG